MRGTLLLAAAAAFVSMASAFVIKTYADALFLAEYGAEFVPHFMVGQALALVGLSASYGRLIQIGKTVVFDVVVLGAVVTFAATAPLLARQGGPWVFGVALGLIAGSALAQMVVWNATMSVVSGRAARAFLPRAGAAATAGAVVGGFGSSAIVSAFSLQVLAPVAGGLTLVALGLRLFLRSSRVIRRVSAQTTVPPIEPELRGSLRTLVMLLAAATVIEAMLSAVVDFGFKREVELSIGGNSERIGLFLSLFYGTSNVLLLAVQLFAASRILATRSLKFSLGVQPTTQCVAAIGWALMPMLPLAAVARGLENVFKFGIARPAQEVALTPLRETERKRWKVLLRGVYAQGGALGAGLLLILSAPLLALHPSVVPAIAAALASAWVILQRRTANSYRETLCSALGLRRRLSSDEREGLHVDRDSLAWVVELAGDADKSGSAQLAHELLDELAPDSKLLTPHLRSSSESARRAVYRVLAARPDKACASPLRRALEHEDGESSALADGLLALGSHGDHSLSNRAREVAGDSEPDTDSEPQSSAWLYLAAVGKASDDERDQVLATAIHRDGPRASRLAESLLGGGLLDAGQLAERVVAAIDSANGPEQTREALLVAARLGHPALLGRLLRAVEAGTLGAEAALAELRSDGLARMAEIVAEQPVLSQTRKRFVRALRGMDAPEVTAVVAPYLLDSDAEVRDVAAHTLLSQVRRGHPRPPARVVAQALDAQLDRFEIYVTARPGSKVEGRESAISLQVRNVARGRISREAFFLDELDRRTERELGRVSELLALSGDPSTVYAAARALKSTSFKRRRQALDLLQESTSNRQRARLLELLDRYLLPPTVPPNDAREQVCELDPWLAKCLESESPWARKLRSLRNAPLFDAVPGEAVEELLADCKLESYPENEVIVRQGDPGNALYVIMDGTVSVKRDSETLTRLGPGEAFGELALLDDKPRGATVTALQDCKVLRLPDAPFSRALDRHSELALGLVRGLVRMLRNRLHR